MKLSIVVPFFNAQNHLDRCVTSLVNQGISFNDYEIILINDGSTDNSRKTAESLLATYPNIVLHNQKNKGLGASRNVGITLAKGKYIYFIDADDYLAYNTFSDILEIALKENIDVIGFKTQVTESLSLFNSNSNNSGVDYHIINGCDFLATYKNHRLEAWWYIMNKEFLLSTELKYEEGKFMEDAIFTCKMYLKAKKVIYMPLDVHRYVKQPDSIMNSTNNEHLNKIITDYVSLTFRFNTLINSVLNSQLENKNVIAENIKFKSTASIYFMFFKFIRSKISIANINKILADFKKINIYPLTGLIGEVYSHPKIKITAFIFNHKYLFFVLLYPLRILNKYKLIKLF